MSDNIITFLNPIDSENKNEDKVYHYTTLGAFKNILETKSLHLTHISYMNDYTEFDNGMSFFWEEWLPLVKKEKPSDDLLNRIESCAGLKEAALHEGKRTNLCFLSCSVGEKSHDLLNQWRVYAEDGFGVAIGFDTKAMQEICNNNIFSFTKCLYDEDQKIKAYNKLFEQLKRENLKNNDFKNRLLVYTAIFSLFSKNEHFRDENEAKIATTPGINLDVKESNNRLVAYYCMDIKKRMRELFKEIVIGPCNISKLDQIHQIIEILLQKSGIDNCKIYSSEIPYRSHRS